MYRIVSATGEENRTMSQLIFNPNINQSTPIDINQITPININQSTAVKETPISVSRTVITVLEIQELSLYLDVKRLDTFLNI